LGRFDVVEAEDPGEIQRAAMIIRSYIPQQRRVGDALEKLLVESIARPEELSLPDVIADDLYVRLLSLA
jgi:hypothetical protein